MNTNKPIEPFSNIPPSTPHSQPTHISAPLGPIPTTEPLETAAPLHITASNITKAVQQTEEEQLESVSSHLWKCIGRKEVAPGCFVYQYRLRDEFNWEKAKTRAEFKQKSEAEEKMVNSISPAVEFGIDGMSTSGLDVRPEWKDKFIQQRIGIQKMEYRGTNIEGQMDNFRKRAQREFKDMMRCQTLGYGFRSDKKEHEYYLEVPDKATLDLRWKDVMKNEGIRYEMKVAPSIGVAGNEDFVLPHREHNCMLGVGIEGLHDHFSHIEKTIIRIANYELDTGNSYEVVQKEVSEILGRNIDLLHALAKLEGKNVPPEIQKLIDHLPILWTSMGLFVDNLSAIDQWKDFLAYLRTPMVTLAKDQYEVNEVHKRVYVKSVPEGSPLLQGLPDKLTDLWTSLANNTEAINKLIT